MTVLAERSVLADGLSTAAFSMDLPQLKPTLATHNQQWLVFAREGGQRWRSRELPLIRGGAEIS